MARHFLKNNSQDFWLAARKGHIKTINIINNIDGVDNVQGLVAIANLCTEKYNDLYNSVSCDENIMSTLMENIK